MAIGAKLENMLAKKYAASSRIDARLGKYDLTFITNHEGDPVTLFIGKRNPDGTIRGERYARTMVSDPVTGKLLKSHWDLKGHTNRG
jgi:hypothetical protein